MQGMQESKEIHENKPRAMRAKLIFNPSAGVLAVMVGKATPEALPASGESLEAPTYAGAG